MTLSPSIDFILSMAPGVVPAEFYWVVPRGDARLIRLHLLVSGHPVDLTNYTITLTARRTVYDPTPAFQASGAADTIPTSALLTLPATDTATAGSFLASILFSSSTDGPFTAIGQIDVVQHA